MNRKTWTGIFSALGILLLILDAKCALEGARDGLRLCIMTVIPSLFPFFVLSTLLTGSVSGTRSRLLRPIGRLCRMEPGTEGLYLIGLLGGYPTGVQVIRQAREQGCLSPGQARRMLGFCSNAGPAFIFGICGSLFTGPVTALFLWATQILSSLAVGAVLPNNEKTTGIRLLPTTPGLPEAMQRGIRSTASVCGWVVLFRVLISLLQRWLFWLPGTLWQICLSGLLELTNGCTMLASAESAGLRYFLCSLFLSIGGLCVTMQTVSAAGDLGLGLYLPGKALQTLICAFFSCTAQPILFPKAERLPFYPAIAAACIAIIPLFCLLMKRIEKKQ